MNLSVGVTCSFFLFQVILSWVVTKETCDVILCSNFYDPVCGLAISSDGTSIIKKFYNVCHLSKIRCRLESLVEIKQIPDEICNLSKPVYPHTRRATDFDIVGAQKTCNHTCPTYCRDTYDPACAKIWKPNSQGSSIRIMINHCHIDMFSCVTGLNVTIQPLSKCFKDPTKIAFISHIAALRSLQLINDH